MRTQQRDDYIIRGWIRENTIKLNIYIPDEIIKTLYIWYHLPHKILQFSDIFQTLNGWRLYENKTLAIRKPISTKYNAYITPKCKGVSKGIHCWRVYILNPSLKWIGYFVGKSNKSLRKKSYYDRTGIKKIIYLC